MKSVFLATSLFMVTMCSFSMTATVCPSAFAQSDTLVSKTIRLQYVPASEAARRIKASKNVEQPESELPTGLAELTYNDTENSLLMRGTPAAIAKWEATVHTFDVQPRIIKVQMRVIEIKLTADGKTMETLVQSPILTTTNDFQAGLGVNFNGTASSGFSSIDQSTRVDVTPHIQTDRSIRLDIAFAIARPGGKKAEFNSTSQLKPNEWKTIRTVSLANDAAIQKALQSNLPPDPAAYPLYRLEASAADISDDKPTTPK